MLRRFLQEYLDEFLSRRTRSRSLLCHLPRCDSPEAFGTDMQSLCDMVSNFTRPGWLIRHDRGIDIRRAPDIRESAGCRLRRGALQKNKSSRSCRKYSQTCPCTPPGPGSSGANVTSYAVLGFTTYWSPACGKNIVLSLRSAGLRLHRGVDHKCRAPRDRALSG